MDPMGHVKKTDLASLLLALFVSETLTLAADPEAEFSQSGFPIFAVGSTVCQGNVSLRKVIEGPCSQRDVSLSLSES